LRNSKNYHFLTLKAWYHTVRVSGKSLFPANSSGTAVRGGSVEPSGSRHSGERL
jgi:hypothetical protein